MEEPQKAAAYLGETKRQLQEERDTFQKLTGWAKEFVGFRNIGGSVEEVGLRQQQRKLKQFKSHAEKALWVGRTFVLIPHALELKMTESNEMVKVKINDEGEATKVIRSQGQALDKSVSVEKTGPSVGPVIVCTIVRSIDLCLPP